MRYPRGDDRTPRHFSESGLRVQNSLDRAEREEQKPPGSGEFVRARLELKLDALQLERRYRDSLKLIELNRALVGAHDFEQVAALVCSAVRALTGADGATFVLREGDQVHYAAEDAISPLWKGQSFPIERCISGWAILHRAVAVIEDIFSDPRIPVEAYRPTFVRSLVMTPVGPGAPVASIGAYWSRRYRASGYSLELLDAIASAADLALSSVRAYEESERARLEAARANELKDQFLATLSHELRNPLSSMVAYSELLLRSSDTRQIPLVRTAADSIHRNAKAQAQIIHDLLDFSRIQTGKFALERQLISLAPLVGEAVESVRARAQEKRIKLDVDLPAEPFVCHADPVRIQQIVWNLVSNAVKFTAQGGRVCVHLTREGAQAQLVVQDNGQGIAPEFLPHVFEMFRQGDEHKPGPQGGLGIGLALVKQLAELHGGSVEASSEGLGCGARFVVRLALQPDTAPHHSSSAGGRSPSHAAGPSLPGARILVVDDTEEFLEVIALLLGNEGAQVTTARSAEEALKTAQSHHFDLVVSDISMPDVDGYQLVQALRLLPSFASTPTIALTGFGRQEDVERTRCAGFSAHLTKPVHIGHLVELARVLIPPRAPQ
ncbi:MAG TPA: ATP-binding protein [Polyangiaceae bacterium]|nr:ATP-binding protein [Polyangiaceae bacterium]